MRKRLDIRNATVTDSVAHAATAIQAHLEHSSMPLCKLFHHSRNGVADRGELAKSQKSLDKWGKRLESVPTRVSDAVPLDFQHNTGERGFILAAQS